MRKVALIAIVLISWLAAQDVDTSVTKLSIQDVKYFDVISDDMIDGEKQIISDKPFALIQPNDKWFSKDKWMHFTTTYFLTLQSTYALEKMFFTAPENSRNISIGISLSFSLGKEFYDVFQKKGIFSWKDLLYDALGTGLGYLTATALQKIGEEMIHVLKYCDQCGTCVAVCPADAMMLGEFRVEIDHKACTECGICIKMCPIAALEVKNED